MDADEVRAAPTTRVIAARVAALREDLDLSGAKLAARLNEHGVPWNRNTVAKFETGRRASVTTQELLALALALDVPPLWLLVDPTDEAGAPVAGDERVNPWWALLWMMGRQSLDPNGRFGQEWARASRGLWHAWNLFSGVQSLQILGEQRTAVAHDLMDGDGLDESTLNAREVQILKGMREPIADFRKWGYAPYPLPTWVRERAAELGVQLGDPEEG